MLSERASRCGNLHQATRGKSAGANPQTLLNAPSLRRKRALVGGAAVLAGLISSSQAWAQCADTLNILIPPSLGGGTAPGSEFFPLSKGAAAGSIISSINTANTAFLTGTAAFVSSPGNPQPDQQGGGVWSRVIGGTVDNSSSSVTTPTSTLFGLPTSGNTACSSKTRTDYSGFQVGHDISILNGGGTGANWHWGVTAGYFESDSKDTTFGSFSSNVQVPFAGFYTVFTKGNLSLDGQARWEFYKNTVSDISNGLFAQTFNGHGFSLTGNASYNIPLQRNWFVEPSLGFIWSRVQLDPLDVAGTFVQLNSPFFGAPGTVQIGEIESALGRASVSIGTSVTSGRVTWQPFFTASVFHEFAGDVKTTISTHFEELTGLGFTTADNGTATQTTSRVGTYGQFTLGTAAILANTGWLGYGRVDYRIGENIEGWSVNAGLRYQFTPPAARSGSIKDSPELGVEKTYNWTGPYIGAFAGRMWDDQNWKRITGETLVNELAGYLAGGQAGFNIQLGRVVVGLEGDYGFSNAKGAVSCPNAFFFSCEAEANHLATVAGRLGYTWGRALFYGKAGWAGGEVTATTHLNTGLGNPIFIVGPFATPVSTTHWMNGWTYGGGMEFALNDRWSAKAEYMHFDLGEDRFRVTDAASSLWDISTRGDTVRVGVNLHFNGRQEQLPLK
jgi:opacity protein-like surface antigen